MACLPREIAPRGCPIRAAVIHTDVWRRPRRVADFGRERRGDVLNRIIRARLDPAPTTEGPNRALLNLQLPLWDLLCKYYFRVEINGWERVPERNALLVGVHSGGSL